jgi:hypothetical protein
VLAGPADEQVGHGSEGRLRLVLAVVQARLALAAEGLGNPGVGIGEAPDGDADAARCGEARADHGVVVHTLLGQRRGRGGRVGPDVELGEGDINVEGGEGGQNAGHLGLAGRLADDHMGLESDTIDAGTGGLDELDDLAGAGSLGGQGFEVVVVVVQLGGRVCSGGSLESNGEVAVAQLLVENIIPVCAILEVTMLALRLRREDSY